MNTVFRLLMILPPNHVYYCDDSFQPTITITTNDDDDDDLFGQTFDIRKHSNKHIN